MVNGDVAILCPFRADDFANSRHWFLNVFVIFLFVAVLASRVAFEDFIQIAGIICNCTDNFWHIKVEPNTFITGATLC